MQAIKNCMDGGKAWEQLRLAFIRYSPFQSTQISTQKISAHVYQHVAIGIKTGE